MFHGDWMAGGWVLDWLGVRWRVVGGRKLNWVADGEVRFWVRLGSGWWG